VDLDAVRTFVAVADAGQFQLAASELALTQQAVSKRIAALERSVGVRLFTRTPRGARLTTDGEAFLPHARELLRVQERAAAALRHGRRPLRVDVIARRVATAALLRDFHHAHPDVELEVVALVDAGEALGALRAGTLDATFRALPNGVPGGLAHTRVLDEPLTLLTGPAHPLAAAPAVRMTDLRGHRIWVPGILEGSEWGAFYDELAAAFGLSIDALGPNWGSDALLEALADSSTVATFWGEQPRLPAGHDLRRIAVHDPAPVYPHELVWRAANPHPALAALRDHLGSTAPAPGTWTPSWA
jgi:DNA-binding transcriptional LysR family regulator